jgi:hypothetical protein
VPGSPYPQRQICDNLDRAIAEGRVEDAWAWARGLRQVGLDQALALTVLLGRSGDGRYLRASHRFLARLIVEAEPSLLDLKKVVDALDVVGRVRMMPEISEPAEEGLADLARQLAERGGG